MRWCGSEGGVYLTLRVTMARDILLSQSLRVRGSWRPVCNIQVLGQGTLLGLLGGQKELERFN